MAPAAMSARISRRVESDLFEDLHSVPAERLFKRARLRHLVIVTMLGARR
jgi:hypothetical protein